MARAPIVLQSTSGSLTLTLDEQGVGEWCQMHLVVDGVSRALGADTLPIIVARLAAFLGDNTPGQRGVLSLAELHTTFYGEHVGEATTLRLLGGDGNWFAMLELTPTERRRWLDELLNVE